MVRAFRFDSDSRIDFGRVLAIAAALVIHAIALLLLLMPLAAPQIAAVVKQPKPEIRWYPKEETKPEVVPIVEERKITPARETPKVTQTRPTIAPPIAETPVIVDGGTEAVIETSVEPTGQLQGAAITGPLASATLEYVKAPAPRYPISELRSGVQGTVMLRVLVDTDGTPIEVQIETSSGSRTLDKEARQHVLRTWRFKPAMRDGVPVQAYGLVPIDFSLQ